jgi:hypothetical protein
VGPYLKKKKKSQNKTGRVAEGVCSEFKSQYHEKNENVHSILHNIGSLTDLLGKRGNNVFKYEKK